MDHPPELRLLLESFDRNTRVNLAMIDVLTLDDLETSDGHGGRTINEIVGELVAFRKGWLSKISPEHAANLPWFIQIEQSPYRLTTSSLEEVADAFKLVDAAARTAVLEAVEQDRSFEQTYVSHPGHFLQHVIVHDAHHRGQIMTLLRQSGRTPEQMDALDRATWFIWRE
jgi:uncharacterized damage-inducible protein DinB